MNDFETTQQDPAAPETAQRDLRRDLGGLVLFALAIFLGVSVVMAANRPDAEAGGSTAMVTWVVRLLGTWPLLVLSGCLGFLGARVWIAGAVDGLARNALWSLFLALALALTLGAASAGAGGAFGHNTGGAIERLASVFVAVPLGLATLGAVVWFGWLRPPEWKPVLSPDEPAPSVYTPSDSEGLTADEAEALLPSEATEEVAQAEITGRSIPVAPDLPPLYPPDVRREGRIPEGARPLESRDEPAARPVADAPERTQLADAPAGIAREPLAEPARGAADQAAPVPVQQPAQPAAQAAAGPAVDDLAPAVVPRWERPADLARTPLREQPAPTPRAGATLHVSTSPVRSAWEAEEEAAAAEAVAEAAAAAEALEEAVEEVEDTAAEREEALEAEVDEILAEDEESEEELEDDDEAYAEDDSDDEESDEDAEEEEELDETDEVEAELDEEESEDEEETDEVYAEDDSDDEESEEDEDEEESDEVLAEDEEDAEAAELDEEELEEDEDDSEEDDEDAEAAELDEDELEEDEESEEDDDEDEAAELEDEELEEDEEVHAESEELDEELEDDPEVLGEAPADEAPLAQDPELVAGAAAAESGEPLPEDALPNARSRRAAWEQAGLFDDEPVDAYGTPVTLVAALRQANEETAARMTEPEADEQPEAAAAEVAPAAAAPEPEVELQPQPRAEKPKAPKAPKAPKQPEPAPAAALDPQDDLVFRAGMLFLERGRVAVSMLQRTFDLDFKQATALLDQLQDAGLIGPYLGGQKRDILLTVEEWRERRVTAS